MDKYDGSFIQKRHQQIKNMINIHNDIQSKKLTQVQLEDKYETFRKNNPKTWLGLIYNQIDFKQFAEYNKMYEEFYHKTEGEHKDKRFKADVGFSEHLAEKHLYPITGKPSKKRMNTALAAAKAKNENQDNIKVTTEKKNLKIIN